MDSNSSFQDISFFVNPQTCLHGEVANTLKGTILMPSRMGEVVQNNESKYGDLIVNT
jgi:hypothetical protein